MLKTRLHRSTALLMAILLTALTLPAGLPGCAAVPSSRTAVTSQNSSSQSASKPASSDSGCPDQASGTLRIWWPRRQTLNPLLDKSPSGQAASRLIFQSLYQTGEDQSLERQMASREIILFDGLQVMVKLRTGLSFHDGTPILARDAAASLQFILDHPSESPYAQRLNSVKQVAALDDTTLQLILSRPDPWLCFALSFPIIPQKALKAKPFAMIAGSGLFQMQSYSAKDGLLLQRVGVADPAVGLTSIRIIEYNDSGDAMKGFERDEIDLVCLDAEAYSRYQLRLGLSFEPYVTGQVLLAAYNTSARRLLASESRLLFLKQRMLPDQLEAFSQEIWTGEKAEIPLPTSSWLLDRPADAQAGILSSLGSSSWDAGARELAIIAGQGDELLSSVARAAMRSCEQAGIRCRLDFMAAADFVARIQSGGYDVALLSAGLAGGRDPGLLYRTPGETGIAALDILPGRGLQGYDAWRKELQRLLVADRLEAVPVGGHLIRSLSETAARSPFSILLVRHAAVLYGSRVKGQCQPVEGNPYKGIEGLWIWSG